MSRNSTLPKEKSSGQETTIPCRQAMSEAADSTKTTNERQPRPDATAIVEAATCKPAVKLNKA
eukprot:13377587-Alexandrium_andersonii.AAC.1